MQNYLNSTTHTVAWFKDMHERDQLEMKPVFQRNPVWLHPQKTYLIDSILHGYPIPEIYTQLTVDDSGQEKHIVVDGQQRLRSVLEFVAGEFALDDDEAPNWAGLTFDELSSEEKQRVFKYKFVVRELPDVETEELRAIFRRLNRNVIALNKQELRHATYWGGFITSMESIANNDFWVKSGLFTANDYRRMLDIEYISELAVGVLHGPQNKKASLDRWYEAYEEEFPQEEKIRTVFRAVLGELRHVLPDGTRWRKKSDFYTLFLYFAERHGDLPLPREGRNDVKAALAEFGSEVDEFLTIVGDTDQEKRAPRHVANYAHAVQRAASDLANRKARLEALDVVLSAHWPGD